MRAGIGYDVHRLVEGRRLILGGVEIPYVKGLKAHSDGDVIAHAIGDAILGASGLGDLGVYFPPNDPRYEGISSMIILREIKEMVEKRDFKIDYIDVMLVLEEPKVASYVSEMKKKIAEALELDTSRVSVKATTNEGMGFVGRKEGVGAMAVCLLKEPV
ncbi:2-C-methyl-D-erythritol 2,4-cyclodiphosphate synthase [Mesoaciditoga lauensis]|uniref:2-C-methyl-D-erythritol 2,4-cyclodiphosphate synthase n=1 Tax=Mesoaciditoga lauensis TaxID=1495039 RepID=UPI00055E9E36|nr:2-C-methyl-D-erythritol 2,4-cyclodiphosphate synthase [Mesoaciditoga lauensis]